MPQLRRGGRKIINDLRADARDIREYHRTDFDLVWELANHLDEIADALEPMLERAAPPIEEQLKEHDERIRAIEEQLELLKQQPFRRTGTG
jgi:hypothetical protein